MNDQHTLKEEKAMMNLMNTAYTCNMSTILAEDVCAPELRNPKHSGISTIRKGFLTRLFEALIVKK